MRLLALNLLSLGATVLILAAAAELREIIRDGIR